MYIYIYIYTYMHIASHLRDVAVVENRGIADLTIGLFTTVISRNCRVPCGGALSVIKNVPLFWGRGIYAHFLVALGVHRP